MNGAAGNRRGSGRRDADVVLVAGPAASRSGCLRARDGAPSQCSPKGGAAAARVSGGEY